MKPLWGRICQRTVSLTVRPVLSLYLRRETTCTFLGMRMKIRPGVFHPKFHFSTGFLAEYLIELDLKGKRFLEIGTGSGALSILACRMKALVIATDISASAVACAKENARLNGFTMSVVEGDTFDAVPSVPYDVIVVNPPYYPKTPRKESDYAWYCGARHDFFQKFFSGVRACSRADAQIIMVLCEECDMATIHRLASDNKLSLEVLRQKRIGWEMNFVYRIHLD